MAQASGDRSDRSSQLRGTTMAREAETVEVFARLATFSEALVEQFGVDAMRIAETQAESASGEVAKRWHAILNHLRASSC
jgi:hypothetical protein